MSQEPVIVLRHYATRNNVKNRSVNYSTSQKIKTVSDTLEFMGQSFLGVHEMFHCS